MIKIKIIVIAVKNAKLKQEIVIWNGYFPFFKEKEKEIKIKRY